MSDLGRLRFDDEMENNPAESTAKSGAELLRLAAPQFCSSAYSRWQQRRAMKKRLAGARRENQAAKDTGNALLQTASQTHLHTREAVQARRKGVILLFALLFFVLFLVNTFSSCSVLAESGVSMLAGSTYPSEDAAMLGAEAAYAAMEQALQTKLDNYEALHPGYDEYVFELDSIGHDPYVLISLLTAYQEGAWTLEEVEELLSTVFDLQYSLTETVTWEPEMQEVTVTDPETGAETTSEVPYDRSVCTVTLVNQDLSHIPATILTESQLSMYAVYMATQGNRPDLFPSSEYPNAVSRSDYTDYDVPAEALTDERFANMLAEAEKYLGFPYVWGGSSPSTSFDCSGFVCWVINHCGNGWSVGRTNCNGLLAQCARVSASDARPGDLIFFQETYNTTGASHVGIYVGNSTMIHCGDPISYANINSNYWQSHFLTFARLP